MAANKVTKNIQRKKKKKIFTLKGDKFKHEGFFCHKNINQSNTK